MEAKATRLEKRETKTHLVATQKTPLTSAARKHLIAAGKINPIEVNTKRYPLFVVTGNQRRLEREPPSTSIHDMLAAHNNSGKSTARNAISLP